MTSVPNQPSHVWLLCGPGPNRFNDEHNLWCQPADVFTTREKAEQYVADIADWHGVTVEWRSPNRPQRGFMIADLGEGRVWMLCRAPIADGQRRRLACLSGEHSMHRSRARAEQCRAKAEHWKQVATAIEAATSAGVLERPSRLAVIMDRHSIALGELARRTGLSKPTVMTAYHGREVSLSTMAKMALALGVPLSEIDPGASDRILGEGDQ